MNKYFLAILPPEKIATEIVAFQKEIEDNFGAIHTQKTPPHITIIPPFECAPEKLSELTSMLALFLKGKATDDMIIELNNFQRFESRTLFVDVAKNDEFEMLCKELKILFNQQKIIKQRVEKHYFVPHITIANKDIKKRDFKVAWENFKEREYRREFSLKSLVVLKLIEKQWTVMNEIQF